METKHTKGEWLVNKVGYRILPYKTETAEKYTISTTTDFYQKSIANIVAQSIDDEDGLNIVRYSNEECLSNAKLIAEAGTVANETGKTPRQLVEENKELLEALIDAKELIKRDGYGDDHLTVIKITNAIKKETE